MRRETMDMLYAMRVHAMNQHTLDYINCIGGELNDLDRKLSSPKLMFKRVIMRKIAALAYEPFLPGEDQEKEDD